ncbi:class C beta-lactamase-related serine hydrolase [Rhizobium deserti]|uniref:Class C beta-lactamase-related serine hydrolase n=1 Tax=Rhizobium deserti TaxID=2547961 RepID=A0A4R5ULZ5_9HYPH|nr:serine hydrolase [Rhizobium deserti]TDK38882.1 class C beta-lactamase-related serine hydrolase [Rhizobium deserti]
MARIVKVLKFIGGGLLILVAAIGMWLWLYPPALLRIGSGYTAKIVCSNVFIAKRDAEEVLTVDVQAPGNPLLRLMSVSVDYQQHRVRAALLGIFAGNEAVYRNGLGCTVAPVAGHLVPAVRGVDSLPVADASLSWPQGQQVESDQAVMAILSDEAAIGPGMRAVVVVKAGRIVAEAYGPAFSKDTPLLGWSMTKTVNAAIIGTLIRNNKLSLADNDLLPEWHGDGRRDIRLTDLLAMESGLAFNENYGTVADVTRMLYLEPDMAYFTAAKKEEAAPGSRFNYSSGTPILLARIWMDRLGDAQHALDYPHKALFIPLGMRSAVMEVDAAGTFVAGSYMYATARDWARFGLLLARDGMWNGERLLPEGFVRAMHEPNSHSAGRYSRMQTWLPQRGEAGMPADTFFMRGHDGQTIAIMPSLDLVVVRLGLTPSSGGYNPTSLIAAVAKATDADK